MAEQIVKILSAARLFLQAIAGYKPRKVHHKVIGLNADTFAASTLHRRPRTEWRHLQGKAPTSLLFSIKKEACLDKSFVLY
jgi:hypothetical protein